MFIIKRRRFKTGKEEILLQDNSWTFENSGNFVHFSRWFDAMDYLLRLERNHEEYEYHTYEIGICIKL